MKTTTIPLNEENYDLFKTLTPIVESVVSLGGMYDVTMTEKQLSYAMQEMGDNQDYQYLKAHFQVYGNEIFGW